MKIKNETDIQESKFFCILPWIHSHILPDSTVLPCCVSDFSLPYGKLEDKTMKEVWNEAPFKDMRQKMLDDKPVRSCHNCYELEAGKMGSMRQRMNSLFSHHADLLGKTEPDGAFQDIEMKYLDIRFSNLCNFKCRGCSPFCSSQWFDDYKELWGQNINDQKLVNLHDKAPMQKAELDEYLETLEIAYFAGGEPLMMDEHYYCLEKLIELGKDIPIHYNSNLSVLKFKKYDLLELWKKFSKIDLNISLDDIEARGEYFRHGLNWEKFQKNLLLVKKEIPYARFQITCTITLFNIHRIPEIHQKFMELDLIDEYGFTLNPLQDPLYYRTQALPKADKAKVTKKLEDYGHSLEKLYPGKKWNDFKNGINGILNVMNKSDMTKELPRFKEVTAKLDKIRGESFTRTFPELAHIFHSSFMIFVPIKNQEVRIQPLIWALEKKLMSRAETIIFVDENSQDQSMHVLNLELPKLPIEHKLIRLNNEMGRGYSFKIAADYATERNIDFLLTLEEGWEDCFEEIEELISCQNYTNFDLMVGSRHSDRKNLGHFFDKFSNLLTSFVTRSNVQETKGDSIHLVRLDSIRNLEIPRNNNYFYSVLLKVLGKKKKVFYTKENQVIKHRSVVRLNSARMLDVLSKLTGHILKKLT